jgi:general stress protein 26
MFADKQLQFLKEKISQVNTAVFYNLTDCVLRIPNGITSEVSVDSVGQVWFFMNRPKQCINEFDKEFFARLSFLQKGKNFFITVEGRAYLVTDPEDINSLQDFSEEQKHKARTHQLLINLKESQIEYAEKEMQSVNTSFHFIWRKFNRFLSSRQLGYRPYKLELDAVSF